MDQIERIKYYESILNKGTELVEDISDKLEALIKMKGEINELIDYYYSEERNIDLKADEEGKLPADLYRGVLGEDYIYDFLMEYNEIKKLLKKL